MKRKKHKINRMFLTEWVLQPALNIFTFYAYFKVFPWLFKTLKLPCKTRTISEAGSNTPTKCWKDSHSNVKNRTTNCNEWFNLEYHTFTSEEGIVQLKGCDFVLSGLLLFGDMLKLSSVCFPLETLHRFWKHF